MNYRSIVSVVFLVALFTILPNNETFAQKRLLILSWNVESDDNTPATISKQLEEFEGYDLIGLTEVKPDNAAAYADAAAEGEGAKNSSYVEFNSVISTSGRSDRMMLIWDNTRFEPIGEMQELNELNPDSDHRSPMFVKLKLRNSNTIFIFMVNHLARGNADLRKMQAQGLQEWAQNEQLPIIAVGDYNFDYDIDDGQGNAAMSEMLQDDIWKWIRPDRLYKTQASPKFNSILDFIFIANQPNSWRVDSRILTDERQLTDDNQRSDHRPVECRILITD